MGRVGSSITVPGRISDAEAVWYDKVRWPSWIDGFGHMHRLEGDWPRRGACRTWDSKPGGRGRVVEQVIEQVDREGQALEVEDEKMTGVQRVRFDAAGDQTRVTLTLEYRMKEGRLNFPLLDVLFVRRPLADSLQRTLRRFAAERRAEFP